MLENLHRSCELVGGPFLAGITLHEAPQLVDRLPS